MRGFVVKGMGALSVLIGLSFQAMASMPADAGKCEQVAKSIEQLKNAGVPWHSTVLGTKEISQAVEILNQISYPTLEQANQLKSTIESSDHAKNADFFLTIGSDCGTARLRAVRALTATYKNPKTRVADRDVIKSTLRGMLQVPKYPTAMNAAIEMATLRMIVSNQIWSLNSDQIQAMNALESEIRKHQSVIIAKSAPLWEKMDKRTEAILPKQGRSAETPALKRELIIKMMSTEEFEQLKPALVREVDEALKQLVAIRALDLALR